MEALQYDYQVCETESPNEGQSRDVTRLRSVRARRAGDGRAANIRNWRQSIAHLSAATGETRTGAPRIFPHTTGRQEDRAVFCKLISNTQDKLPMKNAVAKASIIMALSIRHGCQAILEFIRLTASRSLLVLRVSVLSRGYGAPSRNERIWHRRLSSGGGRGDRWMFPVLGRCSRMF